MSSGGKLHVRHGLASDLEAVLALERATEFAPHWNLAAYNAAVRAEAGRCLMVAELEGILVGFAVGTVEAEATGELESVVVAENARRRGVGRSLCMGVLGWMREQGAAEAVLEVRSASVGAIALYAVLGLA
jgi:ribosomal-protein-alanine N-acetyltransferase